MDKPLSLFKEAGIEINEEPGYSSTKKVRQQCQTFDGA